MILHPPTKCDESLLAHFGYGTLFAALCFMMEGLCVVYASRRWAPYVWGRIPLPWGMPEQRRAEVAGFSALCIILKTAFTAGVGMSPDGDVYHSRYGGLLNYVSIASLITTIGNVAPALRRLWSSRVSEEDRLRTAFQLTATFRWGGTCLYLSMLGAMRTAVMASDTLGVYQGWALLSLPDLAMTGHSPLQWIPRSCMSLIKIGYPQVSFLSPVQISIMSACWGLGICIVVVTVRNQRPIPRSQVLLQQTTPRSALTYLCWLAH